MPHFQKLYEQLKDVVLLTFSLDENPGLIEPFLQQNKYTFPVIPAQALISPLAPGIPRNWIVDAGGTIRMESIGFISSGNSWEKAVLETIDKFQAGKN